MKRVWRGMKRRRAWCVCVCVYAGGGLVYVGGWRKRMGGEQLEPFPGCYLHPRHVIGSFPPTGLFQSCFPLEWVRWGKEEGMSHVACRGGAVWVIEVHMGGVLFEDRRVGRERTGLGPCEIEK